MYMFVKEQSNKMCLTSNAYFQVNEHKLLNGTMINDTRINQNYIIYTRKKEFNYL